MDSRSLLGKIALRSEALIQVIKSRQNARIRYIFCPPVMDDVDDDRNHIRQSGEIFLEGLRGLFLEKILRYLLLKQFHPGRLRRIAQRIKGACKVRNGLSANDERSKEKANE